MQKKDPKKFWATVKKWAVPVICFSFAILSVGFITVALFTNKELFYAVSSYIGVLAFAIFACIIGTIQTPQE